MKMIGKDDRLAIIAPRLHRFLADARGATAIEYGLIVALLSVAVMAVMFATGDNIKTVLYGSIVNALKSM
jgi:pilus assembly protein Flp/PilA